MKTKTTFLAILLGIALIGCKTDRDKSTEERNPTADPSTKEAPRAGDQYGEGAGAARDPGEPAVPGGTTTPTTTTAPAATTTATDGGVPAGDGGVAIDAGR